MNEQADQRRPLVSLSGYEKLGDNKVILERKDGWIVYSFTYKGQEYLVHSRDETIRVER
jgi:hypothetical protein